VFNKKKLGKGEEGRPKVFVTSKGKRGWNQPAFQFGGENRINRKRAMERNAQTTAKGCSTSLNQQWGWGGEGAAEKNQNHTVVLAK